MKTIRIRFEPTLSLFKAVSMDVMGRQQSLHADAGIALRVCAGKALGCQEAEVSILHEVGRENQPADLSRIDNVWRCFDVAQKGTATQTTLGLA